MKDHKQCEKKLENFTDNMEEKSDEKCKSKQIKPENSAEKLTLENNIDKLENSQTSCSKQSKTVNHKRSDEFEGFIKNSIKDIKKVKNGKK